VARAAINGQLIFESLFIDEFNNSKIQWWTYQKGKISLCETRH